MFRYAALKLFFEELLRRADTFSFAMAADAGCAGKPGTVLMRHDVDIDVVAAVDLAKIEATHGIRSTFFFLTGAETYNVASPINRRHLRWLVDQGFEVALHFDPLRYPDLGDEELLPAVQREAEWLSEIAGDPVRSVSLHNPSQHGRYPSFEGFINAYDPRFFDPDYYLSDSCMGFRGKDPLTFVQKAGEHGLQILLHPFHYSESGGGYPDCYHSFLRRFAGQIDEQMRINETYVRQMGGRRLLQDDR